MATDLRSKTQGVQLTRFWGGEDRGACVQVTPTSLEQFVTLSREEARTLANDLLAFANKREIDTTRA